jgi:CubicO group peptidase (beta-lactamase class C family)
LIGSDPGRVPTGITLDNWQAAPNLGWSFQHVADVVPTVPISRGSGPVASLPTAPSSVGEIKVLPRSGWYPGGSVSSIMRATATDGWILAHRGVVLAEEYLDPMKPSTLHLLMSVSKSLVGSVVGVLAGAGTLSLEQPLEAYVPALASSGYVGATVRQLLDMRSGISFSEDYLSPVADVRVLEEAIGWAPRRTPGVPGTMYDFLLALRQKAPHGGPFEYRSCETDVLGWVCEAAAGMAMPQLMSQTLWSRIGAELDANIGVDSVGTGMFDGGISAALRDLVRFGAMILGEGTSLTGQQVLPAAWVADTFTAGPDSREAFAASATQTLMPGGMYRNQYWFPSADPDVAVSLGIHGQMIYMNRREEVVAAKVSSWAAPQDSAKLFATLAAFDTVAAELGS